MIGSRDLPFRSNSLKRREIEIPVELSIDY